MTVNEAAAGTGIGMGTVLGGVRGGAPGTDTWNSAL